VRLLVYIVLFCLPAISFGADMKLLENNIIAALIKTRNEKTYEQQFLQNNEVKKALRTAMSHDEAFTYQFDSLSRYMGTMVSPDNVFRLFNWNFEKPNGEHMYFGLIMKYEQKRERYIITELFDKSASIVRSNPEKKALDNRNWFGSLYYHIIPFNKGSRTYYALLGWDGNNRLSKKKIIEVMAFSGSKIKFGFPIFKQKDNQWYRRVIFEYSAQASMSLKEYPTKKTTLIVFDHLAPSSGALKGHPEHLFPDGSFDSYELSNGKWIFAMDPDARRNKSIKDKYYNDPR